MHTRGRKGRRREGSARGPVMDLPLTRKHCQQVNGAGLLASLLLAEHLLGETLPNGMLLRPVDGELQLRDSSRIARDSLLAPPNYGADLDDENDSKHCCIVGCQHLASEHCLAKIHIIFQTARKFIRPWPHRYKNYRNLTSRTLLPEVLESSSQRDATMQMS